jgi:hypothetical protein
MSKITMTLNDGFVLDFETVPELVEYIANHRLLGQFHAGQGLVNIWEHADEKIAIESSDIASIIIRDVYSVEVRHIAKHTFHTREDFVDFMVGMGATREHVMTGARYGIYAGEVITRRYDCYITGMIPEYLTKEY